jgi:hypothetical protein
MRVRRDAVGTALAPGSFQTPDVSRGLARFAGPAQRKGFSRWVQAPCSSRLPGRSIRSTRALSVQGVAAPSPNRRGQGGELRRRLRPLRADRRPALHHVGRTVWLWQPVSTSSA